MLNFFQPAQDRLASEVIDLLAAKIIVAAFHVADVELALAVGEKRLLEEWDIFVEKLFLQILRSSRDDDALAGTNDGKEISQRLSGSSAGFDDQVSLFRQSLLDGLRHLQLPAAKFVGGVSLRELASRSEKAVQGRQSPGWRDG